MIHYNKFPFTELQCKLPCSEKPSRNSCHESNTSNPNLPSQFITTDFCVIFKTVWAAQSVQWQWYMLEDRVFKSWQKQENSLHIQTSSSAHPASNSSFFSGSKVASADSLTTHMCIQPSLKISGAIPHSTCLPPRHIVVQLYCTFPSYLCTYLSTGHILSGLIKEPFYTLLIPHMHTTWHIYFIFIDPITLTLWTVPITNLII